MISTGDLQGSGKKDWRILVGVCLLFVAWRLLVFLATHPVFFPDLYEEVYRGIVAREIASTSALPLWDYRRDDYAGGFYVVVLILPFFQQVFGSTMLGLKAFGIAQTGLTLILWYRILSRFVGLRAALLFSLIYIFAPFRYIFHSSLVIGDHAETCLLSTLTIYLFLKMQEMAPGKRLFSSFTLSLLAGFSLWFAYIYAITLAALLLFSLLNRSYFFVRKSLLIAAAGFLGGFSFWIFVNIAKGFPGFSLEGGSLWHLFDIQNLWRPFFSWRELFISKLLLHPEAPNLWQPAYNFALMIYAGIFSILLIASVIRPLKLQNIERGAFWKGPAGYSLIYIIVFLLVQQSFSLVGLRYLVPFFLLAAVLIACFLAALWGRRPAAAALGVSGLIGLAIFSTVIRFDPHHFGEYLSRRGYSIKSLSLARDLNPKLETLLLKQSRLLTPLEKVESLKLLVENLTLEQPGAMEEIIAASRMAPEGYRGAFAYLAGRELMLRSQDPMSIYQLTRFLETRDPDFFRQLMRGAFAAAIFADHLENAETQKSLPPELRAKLFAREGALFAADLLKAETPLEAFAEKIRNQIKSYNQDQKERFLRGVGRAWLREWSRAPKQFYLQPRELENLPLHLRPFIFQGISAQIFRKHIIRYSSPIRWIWNDVYSQLSPETRPLLVSGLIRALERWSLREEILPLSGLQGLNGGLHQAAAFPVVS